jgi:uncharacterized Zn finger protein (UPF0148 family)/uncharacterized protein (DUF433 family)
MGKPVIKAQEIVKDIRAGMDDSALMRKYGLSAKGLQWSFEKLVKAGIFTQQDLEKRARSTEEAPSTAAPRKEVSAKEVLKDIKNGLTDEELMDKHKLTAKGIHSLFRQLIKAGLMTQKDLDVRQPALEGTVEISSDKLSAVQELDDLNDPGASASPPPPAAAPTPTGETSADVGPLIKKLEELRTAGILNNEEFEAKKREILLHASPQSRKTAEESSEKPMVPKSEPSAESLTSAQTAPQPDTAPVPAADASGKETIMIGPDDIVEADEVAGPEDVAEVEEVVETDDVTVEPITVEPVTPAREKAPERLIMADDRNTPDSTANAPESVVSLDGMQSYDTADAVEGDVTEEITVPPPQDGEAPAAPAQAQKKPPPQPSESGESKEDYTVRVGKLDTATIEKAYLGPESELMADTDSHDIDETEISEDVTPDSVEVEEVETGQVDTAVEEVQSVQVQDIPTADIGTQAPSSTEFPRTQLMEPPVGEEPPGAPSDAGGLPCPACGTPRLPGADFCISCGASFDKVDAAAGSSSETVETEAVETSDAAPEEKPIDQQEMNTALVWAAGKGDMEAIGLLLERGADVNARNPGGHTPLTAAATAGHTDAVKLLLNEGADPNSKKVYHRSALELAVEGGHSDVVKLLEACGAILDELGAQPDFSRDAESTIMGRLFGRFRGGKKR